MKYLTIALLVLAGSATAWAGGAAPGISLPDAGSSILLLGLGVAAVGGLRRALRR